MFMQNKSTENDKVFWDKWVWIFMGNEKLYKIDKNNELDPL